MTEEGFQASGNFRLSVLKPSALKLNNGQNLVSFNAVDPRLLPSSTFKIKKGWLLCTSRAI